MQKPRQCYNPSGDWDNSELPDLWVTQRVCLRHSVTASHHLMLIAATRQCMWAHSFSEVSQSQPSALPSERSCTKSVFSLLSWLRRVNLHQEDQANRKSGTRAAGRIWLIFKIIIPGSVDKASVMSRISFWRELKGKLLYETKMFIFVPGCKHVCFCCGVGHFNMEVFGVS